MGNTDSFHNQNPAAARPRHSSEPGGRPSGRPSSIPRPAEKPQLVDPLLEARSFLRSHALDATRIASLSWDDFLKYMSGLNEKCRNVVDSRGKYLLFAIKKGSHDTYLWKATVRICCLKMNTATGKVESRKFLTLPQFLRLHASLISMLSNDAPADFSAPNTPVKRPLSCDNLASTSGSASGNIAPGGTVSDSEALTSKKGTVRSLSDATDFRASILVDRIDDNSDERASDIESNCIICMERKPDVLLPCTHCYCLPCIEQWNDGHRWCPICRDTLASTSDAWVISDFPEQDDFTDYLLTLADEQQQ